MSVINEHNEIDWAWFCMCGQGVYDYNDYLEAYLSIRDIESDIIKEFEPLKKDIYEKLATPQADGMPNLDISEEHYALYGAYRVCEYFEEKRRKRNLMEEAMTERQPMQYFDIPPEFKSRFLSLFDFNEARAQNFLKELSEYKEKLSAANKKLKADDVFLIYNKHHGRGQHQGGNGNMLYEVIGKNGLKIYNGGNSTLRNHFPLNRA